jgi:hypothetical protein
MSEASFMIRSARATLEEALRCHAGAGQESLRPADSPAATLTVHPEGKWFRLPDGQRLDCGRWPLLCRLLVALTAQRLAAPGQPLPVDALLAKGWPGERMAAEAATMRLYTAIKQLRKLGLREVVMRKREGYLLDPAVTARFATG